MRLTGLLSLVRSEPSIAALLRRLAEPAPRLTLGVPDAAKPALLAALLDGAGAPALIVTPRPDRAAQMQEELHLYLTDPERALLFPELDTIPYERVSPDAEAAEARLRVLERLGQGGGVPIVVTSGMALAQRTLAPRAERDDRIVLEPGTRVSLAGLLERLQSLGYETVSLVEAPGQVSRRGGIVDVFPPAADLPLRVELLGSSVESLRTFSAATQRTVAPAARAEIGPAREAAADLAAVQALLDGLDASNLAEDARARFEEEAARLRGGDLAAGGGFYLPFLTPASLLEHFPADALVIVDELAETAHAIDELDLQAAEARADLEGRGQIPLGLPAPHAPRAQVIAALTARPRLLDLHRWATPELPADGSAGSAIAIVAPPFSPPGGYGGRLRVAMHDVLAIAGRGDRAVVTTQQSARLGELFASEGQNGVAADELAAPPPPGAFQLLHGSVGNGWVLDLPDGRLHLITDAELFGFTKQRRPQRTRAIDREAFLADLAPGDFVVHVEHGIAVFQGLVRRLVDGVEREYLELRYAEGDRLYVPTDQVDRISRYVGPSERTPALSRLGTMDWARTKDRVRRAVTDLANELLQLYAQREVSEGHAFSPDQPWQQELEASFPYVETPDQLRAIHEVKSDMESPRPMDRVIVGDVGYGKTEVALRAAFKAVLDGFQVAVLVPTTVLAQQHGQTFRERLSGFPTKVEVLSRFRNEKEQKEMLAAAAAGEVDIVIGTHRILQKDVSFKNLGLVIIDEEQRFGVAHKERLKQMRQQVDVLTLSATPIPRTLQMSLSGIRDMSAMTNAPQDRLPIKTYVAEFDERLVREAILRELDRGGQVYFVHDRVHNIERLTADLRRIVPEAEIAIGHGQMPEEQLEQVMIDFQRGQYDVLVCTTIIESGLDIPSVNTIIINHADRFGLAQLYQLRGRVGRGANRAYAYLLYERNRALSETAQKRLQTIFEATELGAGFQIALRDLEIRGAGNLLGAEQSGHVGAVGFDLYSRMLADAVTRLRAVARGESPPAPSTSQTAVQLDLPLTAYIPESYVADLNVRLALYQRLGQVGSPDEAQAAYEECVDRFGPPPPAVRGLLYALALKGLAREAAIVSITLEDGEFVLRSGGPLNRRDELRRARLAGVSVGTAQARVSSGPHWPARLYAVAAVAAGREERELPAYAEAIEATAVGVRQEPGPAPATPADGAAPRETPWQRPAPFLRAARPNGSGLRSEPDSDRRGFGRGAGRGGSGRRRGRGT
ncbi:MAG TPA: transcription-repair coupling factor [Dehalococcoidia bacterium]|nr:transcription-repair coupling factor [Dehalococcoidia bacterium]